MDEIQLRNLALEYAVKSGGGMQPDQILKVAAKYLAFLKGETPSGD